MTGGATKTEILRLYRTGVEKTFWEGSFGRREKEELYHVAVDRQCVKNLAENDDQGALLSAMRSELFVA